MDNLDIKKIRRIVRESLIEQTGKKLRENLNEQSNSFQASTIGDQGLSQNVKSTIDSTKGEPDKAKEITPAENNILLSVFKILRSASSIGGIDLNSNKQIIIKNLENTLRAFKLDNEQIQQAFQAAKSTPKKVKENMGFDTGGKIRDDGHEVSMAESELYKIAEYAPEIYAMIENYEDLPGWVQKKITIASENISSVKHYLEHEHFRNKSGLGKQ